MRFLQPTGYTSFANLTLDFEDFEGGRQRPRIRDVPSVQLHHRIVLLYPCLVDIHVW